MGLNADVERGSINTHSLGLKVKQCMNSTENNNFCAPIEKIQEMIKYVTVQASIPKTIYDFKNKTNSIKRMYKDEIFLLDWNLKKILFTEINPTFLYKDYGFFSEDYVFDSISFNPTQAVFDVNSKTEENVFFSYQILTSFQIEKYYIRNQKLNDIVGTFGGIVNVLYTIGNFICLYLNRFLFVNSLVNLAFNINFENLEIRNSSKVQTR